MSFSLSPIKIEAYIQHFEKLHSAGVASSHGRRLGLRPVPGILTLWEQRPAQPAAVCSLNPNLF